MLNKPLGKTPSPPPQKGARFVPINRSLKPRSLSQPGNATGVENKPSIRPRSVGDNKKNPPKKPANQNLADTSAIKERDDEDEEYQSATILKACTNEMKFDQNPIAEASQEELDQNSVCESEPKSAPANDNENAVKATVSGIPLRIRQTQPPPSPKTATRKQSPRITKAISHSSTVSSNQNRGGNTSRSSLSPDSKPATPTERRTLETQFQTRKKRLDVMKKELSAKQKMLKDSYHVLVQLKKKLEESGSKNIVLEELVDEGEGDKSKLDELDPAAFQNIKNEIKFIPLSLVETCKQLLNTRLTLLNTLEKVSSHSIKEEDLHHNIKAYHSESATLEKILENILVEQDKQVNDLVEKWQIVFKNSGDASCLAGQAQQLEKKIRQQEQKLGTASHELQQAVQLKDMFERKYSHAESQINEMKDKIKHLEQDLVTEKGVLQSQKERYSTYDHKLKQMKGRVQEAENKCKEGESKYADLQKNLKQTQDQIKLNEERWNKEKEQLLAKNKHDKQLLDKITKDRSVLEARVKTLEKSVEDTNRRNKRPASEKTKMEELTKECESLKEQLAQTEAKNKELEQKYKQASDIVKIKYTYEPSETDGISTDREAELYTELLATRVALKAAEDQIKSYNREKLRFIDSIQMLQGDPDKDQDSVAKTLIKNVETISDLESKLAEGEDAICGLKIEIANLMAEIENLRQRNTAIPVINDDSSQVKENDLKLMLHEGKLKLEQSLKKSLEYEQRIIRYEHDLNRQGKQICEMENLLKVRDGLISMMKAKKDELQMENDSLNKYANEIRDLLIQAKEEGRNRTELVQELTVNLDTRGRICQQLEKKVKELEGSLSNTNEKRFKLQETIGAMEKELQSTKATMISLNPELQSRYEDDDLPSYNTNIDKVESRHTCLDHGLPTTSANDASTCLNQNIFDKHKKRPSSPSVKLQHTKSHTDLKQASRLIGSTTKHKSHLVCSDDTEPLSNSYEHVQYIQKRLKFLKYAFKSLSKTLFHRDIKLKRVPLTALATYADELSSYSQQLAVSSNEPKIFKNNLFKEYTAVDNLCISHTELSDGSTVTLLRGNMIDDSFNSQDKNDISLTTVSSIFSFKDDSEHCVQPELKALSQALSDNILRHKNTSSLLDHMPHKNLPSKVPRRKVIDPNKSQALSLSFSTPLQIIDNSVFKSKKLIPISLHKIHEKLPPLDEITCQKTNSEEFPHVSSRNSKRLHRRSRPLSPKRKKSIPTKTSKSEPPSVIQKRKNEQDMSTSLRVTKSNIQNPSFSSTSIEECSKFINHVHNISHYMEHKHTHGDSCKAKKQYVLKLLPGMHQRKAREARLQKRCSKSHADMEISNVTETHNLIVHSLNKINADLTSSINILSQNFKKTHIPKPFSRNPSISERFNSVS